MPASWPQPMARGLCWPMALIPWNMPMWMRCPALLRYPLRVWIIFAYAPVTLYGSPFQKIRLTTRLVTLLLRTLQPPKHRNATGLGSSEFARHYYRNRGFFLFLQVLRWFTSLSSLM